MKSDRPFLKNVPELLFEIKSVGTAGEKATATVLALKTGKYTVVFADYENGRLKDVNIAPFTVTTEKLGEITVTSTKEIKLGKDDKIMLWDDFVNITPLCDTYEIK